MNSLGSMARLCAIALLLSASCALGPSELSLSMPRAPAAWEAVLGSRSAGLSLYEVDSSGTRLIAEGLGFGDRIAVGPDGAGMRAYLAHPVGRGLRLKPAGILLPLVRPEEPAGHGPRRREIKLSFEDGWMAAFAAELLGRAPLAAEAFDWARIKNDLDARSGDPWILSPREAADRVLDGSFSAVLFRRMQGKESFIRVAGSIPMAERAWIAESPFATARVEEGAFRLSWEPSGGETLYAPDARALIMEGLDGELEARILPEPVSGGG